MRLFRLLPAQSGRLCTSRCGRLLECCVTGRNSADQHTGHLGGHVIVERTISRHSTLDLRPLTGATGQVVGLRPTGEEHVLTRGLDRSNAFTCSERCASGAPRTVSVVKVQGAFLPRTSWRLPPPPSSAPAGRRGKEEAGTTWEGW